MVDFNQYQKSDRGLFIIYADLESLIQKIYGCKNNLENSFTRNVGEHIPSGFSVSTVSSFKGTLMQIWKSANTLSLYENNMLKISQQNTFFFLRCTREICENFVYKYSETVKYV